MFWIVLKWSLIVAGGSLVAVGLILAWDWFFYRRLPHVRWRMSQLSSREMNIIREVTRIRRLSGKKPSGDQNGTYQTDEVKEREPDR